MVEQTGDRLVDELDKQKRHPVLPLRLKGLRAVLVYPVRREPEPLRGAAVNVVVALQDHGVIRARVPGRRRVRPHVAGGVCPRHPPNDAKVRRNRRNALVQPIIGLVIRHAIRCQGAKRTYAGGRASGEAHELRGWYNATLEVLQNDDTSQAIAPLLGVDRGVGWWNTLSEMASDSQVKPGLCDVTRYCVWIVVSGE